MNEIRFDGRVALVTGAGTGLGRCHAVGLAKRGACVVVNDVGTSTDGSGRSLDAAEVVAREICDAGGKAIAHGADVCSQSDVEDMVQTALKTWGRMDICVNNAGILRDKTFAKMSMEDFRKVVEVHLIGSATVTHAVWPIMREQGYGRVVLTASASGLYGNFGQANYGAAKAAMLGLMNVLHLEGARDDIRVNTLAPTAATRMTEDLLPYAALSLLKPETITPGLLYLVSENAPNRVVLGAGGGSFAVTKVFETAGVTITEDITPEAVAARWAEIESEAGQTVMPDAFAQTRKYALAAAAALGVKLEWG